MNGLLLDFDSGRDLALGLLPELVLMLWAMLLLMHAAWRLRRCSTLESEMESAADANNDVTQRTVDRAPVGREHHVFSSASTRRPISNSERPCRSRSALFCEISPSE